MLSCNIESDLKVGNVLIALLLIGLVVMTRRNVPNVSKALFWAKTPSYVIKWCQGGRSWQPFGGGKNAHKKFV